MGDGGEVVVGEHHLRRFLGGLGAAVAHRHPDVRPFQRRRVVDAVAGHCHRQTSGLQRLDQAQLMQRAGSGVDVGISRPSGQCLVVELVQIAAGRDDVGVGQADRPSNRRSRAGVIARDHLHPNAGVVAACDGFHGLPSWRIGEPEHPQQRQPRGDIVEAQFAMLGGRRLACQREHPLAAAADLVDPAPPEAGCERLIAVGATLPVAHLEDLFGCTLGVEEAMAGAVVVQRRHEKIFGLERDDVGARISVALDVPIESGLDADDDQRALGRVAVDPPFIAASAEDRVAAQHRAAKHLAQQVHLRTIDLVAVPQERAARSIALARDFDEVLPSGDGLHHHLVTGQGAGLVGADDADRAQRFDGGQSADDRVAPCHSLHADRQRDRHDCRQPLGNCRHREADAGEEHVSRAEPVDRHAEAEDEGREREDQHGQRSAEASDLLQERRSQRRDFAQHGADLADFGMITGGDDDTLAATGGDQRPGVNHAGPVAQRR